MLRSPKFTYIIRIIAAAYIIYLAFSLIGEIQKGAVTGGMLVLGIIGIIAFFVFSVWAIYSAVKGLAEESKQTDEKGEEVDEEEAQRIAEEEEKARIIALTRKDAGQENSSSLFARMQRFSNETSDDETEDEPEYESEDESE